MPEQILTEITFQLPIGYLRADGGRAQCGLMRMPTQKDLTVVIKQAGNVDNPAYLETLMLSRIVVELESVFLDDSNRQEVIESLVLPDIEHLNAVYERLMSGITLNEPPCDESVEKTDSTDPSND